MTTASHLAKLPTPTPKLTQSLPPQQRLEHRATIGFEVEVILDGYWRERPSEAVKRGILADWMDELEDWHVDQVRAALRQWRTLNPSKKPNPAHIAGILKGKRGQAYVAERDGKTADPLFAIDRPLLLETTT